MYLKRREDLTVREVDGEIIVLNTRLGQIHQLNSTASYVWNLCDGKTSVKSIIDLVARKYGASAIEVEKDVANVIAQFQDKELVKNDFELIEQPE